MNRIHTTIVIAGLCAVIAGWQIWHLTPPAPDSSNARAAPTATVQETAAPATDPGAPSATADTFDLTRSFEEHRNCYPDQVVLHPETGEPVDAIACEPTISDASPYESWSEPVLAGLAYGDPVAAEVLGLRHIQSEDPNREALGLMLLYRSVALSGETTSLHRAISERYATVSTNGKPEIHNLKQLLVFAIVATRLGDDGINAQGIEARLAKAEVPAGEVARLKSTAEQILQEMASIEAEVTGNSTIAEALSNA